MDFETVAYLRANSRAWRLLRADTAPLAIHVLGTIFIVDNVRTIAESDLIARVDDLLYAVNAQTAGTSQRTAPDAVTSPGRRHRAARPAHLSALGPRLRRCVGIARAGLAAQVLPRRPRRGPLRRDGRRRAGLRFRRRIARPLLRRHRVPAQHDRRAAAREMVAEPTPTRVPDSPSCADAATRSTPRSPRWPAASPSPLDAVALLDRYQHFSSTARELLSDFRSGGELPHP